MATVNGVLVSAATGAFLALSGAAASAQGMFFGTTPEWYVKGFGGATFLQDSDADFFFNGSRFANGNISFDTGYTVGAALGAVFTPNFVMELEYAYRRADVDHFRIGGVRIPADHTRSDTFMLNALYVFDGMGSSGAFRPFAGGGVGASDVEISIPGGDLERDWILAYQVIGGVAYDLTPNWSLTGEVRWFATEGGRYAAPGGGSVKLDWETVDLLVGAAYRF